MSMDVLPALHPICSGSQAIDLVDVDAATGGYVGVVASTARNFVGPRSHLQADRGAIGTAASAAPTKVSTPIAPPPEQPPSVSSPPIVRVNMFAHIVETGDEAEVDDSHLLEGSPSLHGSGRFRPSRSPARRPRHHNPGPRSATTPARRVWRRPWSSQPPWRIRGRNASCCETSSSALGFGPTTSSLLYSPTLFAWDPG
jgi:hypothetical protein